MVKGGPERRPPHRDESRAAGQVWELRRRPCKGHSRPSKGCLCGKDGGRGGMWWAEDQLQRARPGESGKPSRTALNRGRLQDGLGKAGGRSPRSFSYTDSYNADIRFDNIYISTYFCQIDERRKKLGKRTLLPLRKAEKKTVIFPYDPAIQALEMKNLIPELLETLPVLLLLAVLCGLDWALYSAFDTIRHHSFLQYSFRSSHKLEVKVGGDSMLARLLRKTIGALNTSSESVVESSNIPCLPQPVALDAGAYVRTALPVGLLVCLCLLQAFGYRLRRVIAAFYFPKREKKRILFLYNELLRKRAAFTQLRRAAIVRQAQQQRAPRHRLADILHRSCPLLRPWLRRRCVVCQAPETPESYVCQTPECKAVYCRPCWDDMRRRCPACTPREELSSSAFSDSDDDVTYAE